MKLFIMLFFLLLSSYSFSATFYEELEKDGANFYEDQKSEGVTLHAGHKAKADVSNEGVKTADSLYNLHMSRGLSSLKSNDLTSAEAEFRAALREKPDDYEATSNLGSVLIKKNATESKQ